MVSVTGYETITVWQLGEERVLDVNGLSGKKSLFQPLQF